MNDFNPSWEAVIGLEVHVQLNTRTKLFSRAPNEDTSAIPNQTASLFDLAYPGTLPVLNQAALRHAIRFGAAIDSPIANVCAFDRKNYFYPDLPKGYQISQYSQPIVGAGMFHLWLDDGQTKTVRIRQAHLEEDAGKSIHDRIPNATVLDFNRAGTPLLEIVTEPDLHTAQEAAACFRQLRALVIWLDLCTGKLNEGAMRCDANVSLRPIGSDEHGAAIELKNLNSFRFLEKGLQYEIERQTRILSAGNKVRRETRSYDPATGRTKPLRRKEQTQEYRYFPDPDLPPIPLSEEFISHITSSIPELPSIMRRRFVSEFGLAPDTAYRLTLEKSVAKLFEATAKLCATPHATANWILGDLTALQKTQPAQTQEFAISAKQLAQLIVRVNDGTISSNTGKDLLKKMSESNLDLDQVIENEDMTQISDGDQIANWTKTVVEENQELVSKLLNGDEKLYEFFIGEVMKLSRGKASPQLVRQSVEKHVLGHSRYL